MKQIDFDAIPDVRPATLTTSREVLIQTIGEHINEARTINANWLFADTLTVRSEDGNVFVEGRLGHESEDVSPVESTDAYNVGAYALSLLGNGKVSVLAFRMRFTATEKAMIELAAVDNPNGTTEERLQAASLRAYLADLAVAKFVDLSATATRAGVHMLESVGLLAEGRASEILDTPFTDLEAP